MRAAALWIAVAIGFSLPISTALDGLLEVALIACWIAGGRWRERLSALRHNAFALFPCAFFLLHVAGSAYSLGGPGDIGNALGKASALLGIPLLISLRPGGEWRARALQAFAAAMLLTLALSFLFWWGLLPEGGFIKGTPADAVVFKLKITHSVFMAFAAYLLALCARDSRQPGPRWLFAALALLAGFNVLFMVQGRTGQLVLIVLLAYFLINSLPRRAMLPALGAGVLAVGAAYYMPTSSLHLRAQTTIHEFEDWRAGKPATLANMRLESWSNSLEIVRQYPALGVGTGGFAAAYARQVGGTSPIRATHPENQYLLTAVQLGALGVAALLALFAAQWHLAARLATPMDTELARAFVLTMMVGCLFNSFLWDHTESLFYAWLSGLLFASLRPRENSDRGLESRVANEKGAYEGGDVYAQSTRLQSRFSHVFLCPNAVHSDRLFDSIVADVAHGRFVLDYGCYTGASVPALAKCAPTEILGIDISKNAIAEAKQKHGSIADFCVMDGHRLALADETLDVVVGRAILHHLEFDTAIREINRVLKPGGHAVFIEPLRDNPVGRLFRLLTPRARTKDELPLSRAQIQRADRLFGESHHFFSGLVSVGCGMASSYLSRNPGNALMRLAHRLDLKLANSSFKWWMRMVVLSWTKRR